MLYVEMRRAGRYFGGPSDRRTSALTERWPIAGRILLLAPGEGAREYLDRPASSTTSVCECRRDVRTFVHWSPGCAGGRHQRLRERVGGVADTCTFVFEDTLKNIERDTVRVMARTGE